MTGDAKQKFYLANRALIEEWASLRTTVARDLDRALTGAAESLAGDPDIPNPVIKEEAARSVKLHAVREPYSVWFELWWQERDLLKGANGWPTLIVCCPPKHPRNVRDAVRSATESARTAHGLTKVGSPSQWWLRHEKLAPESEPIDVDEYAQQCVERLRSLWVDLHDAVASAVIAAAT